MKNFLRYSSKRVTKNVTPKVSAVLMECPKTSTAPRCHRKIVVNIHASPENASSGKEKYLFLDEVFDQKRQARARLMSPYLIELSRGEPVLMYPLEFVKNIECNSCASKRSHSAYGLKQQQPTYHRIQKLSTGLRKGGPQRSQIQSSNFQNSDQKSQLDDSQVDSMNNENDVTLDIDIALRDEKSNMENVPNDRTDLHTTIHDNVKKNEASIGGVNYDDVAGRSYDAIFEELEQKNEQIRKDILDILKPTFQWGNTNAENGNYVELRPHGGDEIAKSKSETNQPISTFFLPRINPIERSRIDELHENLGDFTDEDIPFQEFSDDSLNSEDVDSGKDRGNLAIGENTKSEFSSTHGNHENGSSISKKNTMPDKTIRRSNNKYTNHKNHQAKYTNSPTSINNVRVSDSMNESPFTEYTKGNIPASLQDKSDLKKDAEFISHINGFGFNIDTADNLNISNIGRVIEIQYHGNPTAHIIRQLVKDDGPVEYDDAQELIKGTRKKSITKIIPFGRSLTKNHAIHKIHFNPDSRFSKDVGRVDAIDFRDRETGHPLKNYQKKRNFVSQSNAKNSVFNIHIKDDLERRNNGIKSLIVEADKGQVLGHDGRSNMITVSGKFGPTAAARENNQDNEGDDYEEDTTNLSGFPYIVAQRPISKFPRVYQRQQSAWLPDLDVPIESENPSPVFSDYIQREGAMRGLRRDEKNTFVGEIDNNGHNNKFPEIKDMLSSVKPSYNAIHKPYLSTKDKMHFMELPDQQQQKESEYLSSDGGNSYKPFIDIGSYDLSDEVHRGESIKKRRFALYDDMEMHDTDVDYEGLSPSRHLPVFDRVQSDGQSPNKQVKRVSQTISNSPTSVEDIWYSVFNMSAPLRFLTTRVRIFRKKKNSWWRIAPSITLTSLSGIYANTNLSILFSSKTETNNLLKPFKLQNYKLLVPKNQTNDIGADKLLAVDKQKLNLDKIDWDENIRESFCEATDSKSISKRENSSDKVRIVGEIIEHLEDLGNFPTRMNVLEQCRNDPNHLCVNVLEEEIPGYNIKVEIPFQDNALIYWDYVRVRITTIIVDGTTNGALEIFITIINEALIVQEYDIVIANCPVIADGQNEVHKVASPHRSVTISFLLPFLESEYNSRLKCEVQIRNTSNHTIARRQMIVQPAARCLCIWECHCHCIKDFVSTLISDMCQELTNVEENEAGFDKYEKYHLTCKAVLVCLLIFVTLLLTLGCLKACLGCCIALIGRWKYNYLQPTKKFDEASRFRRFLINTCFFITCPCVCLCRCFQPTDEDMLAPHSEWNYSVVQTIESSSYDALDDEGNESADDVLFTQEESRPRGGENHLSPSHTKAYTNSVQNYLFEEDDHEEEKRDAQFVLQTLHESRAEIQNVDSHYSEEVGPNDEMAQMAATFVQDLIEAKIVYRTFKIPLGNASLPLGQAYSIRGYFIPTIGPGYQFITHTPLRQHWLVCPDINCLRPIVPPGLLLSKEFARSYTNKMEVYQAGDLSVSPSMMTPCINVLVQDISMYTKSEHDESCDDVDDQ